MKRFALLAAFALAACATGASHPPRVMPEVQVAEVVGPSDVQLTGPFDVKYAVQVTNPSTQPIMLKRVEVRQIGGGAYQILNNLPVTVNTTIDPGGTTQVAFWLHAYMTTLPGAFGSNEPLTIRVVTYYDSASGGFQKITQAIIGQF